MNVFEAFREVMKDAHGPRDLFFAGVAFGALGVRVSQEEIVKMLAEAKAANFK